MSSFLVFMFIVAVIFSGAPVVGLGLAAVGLVLWWVWR